ncbi:hypothetical protein HK096_006641 [Nowakowskiella sp. JEL0078]|nr:hypothetical protein HK096_006641 [Nowakowskiella sp. JEL0078]
MFVTKLVLAVLATSLLIGDTVLAHEEHSIPLVSRELHVEKARRSLANCEAQLRSPEFLQRREAQTHEFVKRHLEKRDKLRKRQTCVSLYGQCGGLTYTGATCCVSGATCTYSNAYYSQCLASSSTSSSTSSSKTTTTASSSKTTTTASSSKTTTSTTTAKSSSSTKTSTTTLTSSSTTKTTSSSAATGTSSAISLFPSVKCVMAPELTEGPYYVGGEYVRPDMRETQPGVELLLDLQFIDLNTCKVIPNAMIEFWHCNYIGVYSGISSQGTLGQTFHRGLQPTDSNGIVQMITQFPGWYTGRATHIHLTAHLNGQTLSNSTYSGGTISHIGQLFFPESVLSVIDTTSPYSSHTVTRMKNSADGIYQQSYTSTYTSELTVQNLGSTAADGYLGYISVGVDTSVDYTTTLNSGNNPKLSG